MNENKKSIALGTFDGLHLGHKSVIELAKKSEYPAYVLLFSEHPLKVICGEAPPELLTDGIREKLLDEMNVSSITVSFADIMNMSAENFLNEILIKELNAASLSCGENYTFGDGGKGDVTLLKKLCSQNNIELNVAPMKKLDDTEISSTLIRKALKGGETELADRMLGRPFSYDFTVVAGDRRGRLLGFPTINQFFPNGFVEPKYGVYASTVTLGNKRYAAVTNFGKRPTIGTPTVRSETCILGFSGDLYGTNVEVGLLSYLRPEIKFADLQSLSDQMKKDSEKAIAIFNERKRLL